MHFGDGYDDFLAIVSADLVGVLGWGEGGVVFDGAVWGFGGAAFGDAGVRFDLVLA